MKLSATAFLCSAILAGCSGPPPSIGANGAVTAWLHPTTNLNTLYSFAGGSDGAKPYAPLLDFDGTFYGTTVDGGIGGGTVFSISASGREQVIYSFGAAGDGSYPFGGLTLLNGTLYGTTKNGGTYQYGTIYSVTPSGTESILHSFDYFGAHDGAHPQGQLAVLGGTLYGTTLAGGPGNCGTVFQIDPSGKYKVIYAFSGASNQDGCEPTGLIAWRGALYGVTIAGGKDGPKCDATKGCGTVFKVESTGKETPIYSFLSGSDGRNPVGEPVVFNETLYGTTTLGGSSDDGVAFSVSMSGSEAILHAFCCEEGSEPYAGLNVVKGEFYGTTELGGRHGGGALFQLTPSGAATVLYSFGRPGGDLPYANLTNLDGTLYGTTTRGGTANAGTVFSFVP